jgi:hypothetical protein
MQSRRSKAAQQNGQKPLASLLQTPPPPQPLVNPSNAIIATQQPKQTQPEPMLIEQEMAAVRAGSEKAHEMARERRNPCFARMRPRSLDCSNCCRTSCIPCLCVASLFLGTHPGYLSLLDELDNAQEEHLLAIHRLRAERLHNVEEMFHAEMQALEDQYKEEAETIKDKMLEELTEKLENKGEEEGGRTV